MSVLTGSLRVSGPVGAVASRRAVLARDLRARECPERQRASDRLAGVLVASYAVVFSRQTITRWHELYFELSRR